MAIVLDGTSGITTPALDSAGTITAPDVDSALNGLSYPDASSIGMRNRIINGDMRIDQRNNGASVTPTDGQYALDRWRCGLTAASKFSVQRNAGAVTPPVGFTNYLGVTSLSAYSVGASDTFVIEQPVEGFNTSDLAWGTASAQSVTLSFRVRSSLTGSFGGVILNGAYNRSYAFSFSISAANTWEQKTITIAGDTTGTWLTTNGVGVRVIFSLGSGSNNLIAANTWSSTFGIAPTGSVNVVSTSGATFYVTGVQIEAGSVATPFERKMYTNELALCQRYYVAGIIAPGYLFVVQNGGTAGEQRMSISEALPIEMRAAPTVTYTFINNDAAVDGGLNTITTRSLRFRGYTSFSGGYWNGRWDYQATAEL